MSDVGRYMDAGRRKNTVRSYESGLRHYEVEWKGLLPATVDNICQYLATYAAELSVPTLKHRLAALSKWHKENRFTDPTKDSRVGQVLRGIKAVHPHTPQQAAALGIADLARVVQVLECAAAEANESGDRKTLLQQKRDLAFLLIGFWRGFRGNELCNLQVQNVHAERGIGLEIVVHGSKGDRANDGVTFSTPALPKLCPVGAYLDWIEAAELKEGPVFRSISRWGVVGESALSLTNVSKLLREILERGGLDASKYSSHSLRHGFAHWAANHGWDLAETMDYVGWSDPKSALRYMPKKTPFERMANSAYSPPAIEHQSKRLK